MILVSERRAIIIPPKCLTVSLLRDTKMCMECSGGLLRNVQVLSLKHGAPICVIPPCTKAGVTDFPFTQGLCTGRGTSLWMQIIRWDAAAGERDAIKIHPPYLFLKKIRKLLERGRDHLMNFPIWGCMEWDKFWNTDGITERERRWKRGREKREGAREREVWEAKNI